MSFLSRLIKRLLYPELYWAEKSKRTPSNIFIDRDGKAKKKLEYHGNGAWRSTPEWDRYRIYEHLRSRGASTTIPTENK